MKLYDVRYMLESGYSWTEIGFKADFEKAQDIAHQHSYRFTFSFSELCPWDSNILIVRLNAVPDVVSQVRFQYLLAYYRKSREIVVLERFVDHSSFWYRLSTRDHNLKRLYEKSFKEYWFSSNTINIQYRQLVKVKDLERSLSEDNTEYRTYITQYDFQTRRFLQRRSTQEKWQHLSLKPNQFVDVLKTDLSMQ